MEKWGELSDRIRAQSWRQEEGQPPDSFLAKLLRDRRAILENADNKIAALGAILDSEDLTNLRHTLIYTSDKAPTQLERVNGLLMDRGILFRQLTHEETEDRAKTAEILKAFQEGDDSGLDRQEGTRRRCQHPASTKSIHTGEHDCRAPVDSEKRSVATKVR